MARTRDHSMLLCLQGAPIMILSTPFFVITPRLDLWATLVLVNSNNRLWLPPEMNLEQCSDSPDQDTWASLPKLPQWSPSPRMLTTMDCKEGLSLKKHAWELLKISEEGRSTKSLQLHKLHLQSPMTASWGSTTKRVPTAHISQCSTTLKTSCAQWTQKLKWIEQTLNMLKQKHTLVERVPRRDPKHVHHKNEFKSLLGRINTVMPEERGKREQMSFQEQELQEDSHSVNAETTCLALMNRLMSPPALLAHLMSPPHLHIAPKKRVKLSLRYLERASYRAEMEESSKSLWRTNRLLDNWSKDFKEVVRQYDFCPSWFKFLLAELKNILGEQYVNLDVVLSYHYSFQLTNKQTEKVRELKFTFTTANFAQSIETSADWITVWGRVEQAYRFMSPFKVDEFRWYICIVSSSLRCSLNIKLSVTSMSSSSTKPSASESRAVAVSSSPTSLISRISKPPTSSHLACNTILVHWPEAVDVIMPHMGNELKSAESSIKAPVGVLLMGASMLMSASNVEKPITNPSAVLLPESNSRPFRDLKYHHHLQWDGDKVGHDSLSPCVCDTFFADPVPQPSDIEWSNITARSTLRLLPYLFKVVTPINVNRFKTLLVDHPNQAFVQSVCYALHNGFWPWAETVKDEYPTTSDHPNGPPQLDCHLDFIAKQFCKEEACSRFSPSFRHDLLPGCTAYQCMLCPNPGPKNCAWSWFIVPVHPLWMTWSSAMSSQAQKWMACARLMPPYLNSEKASSYQTCHF